MTSTSSGVPERLDELDQHARWVILARTAMIATVTVAAIVTMYYVAPWEGGRSDAVVVRLVVTVIVLVAVSAVSIPAITRAPYPTLRAVQLLAVIVVLAIASFATIYLLLSGKDASAFSEPLSRTDALYFSLTTATTIGYGDIHAATEPARIAVMFQMVTNVVVVGVAARVILHVARRQADER